jgi:hypothetical protein
MIVAVIFRSTRISCLPTATHLVFGDLHGRILPAFHLALAWEREHGEHLAGLLQVGDLGYFPDASRLDKATKRHARRDPLELGARMIAAPGPAADAVFGREDPPPALWFTTGNHEDYDALEALDRGPGSTADDFPVDAYGKVRCIKDGHVVSLPGGLRVAALWGIDPGSRQKTPRTIRERSAWSLAFTPFDVLLTHDAPRDLVYPDSGSEAISLCIEEAKPSFAFFGHYHPGDRLVTTEKGPTRIFHLHGLELQGAGGTAEPGSVGVLRWEGDKGRFDYLEAAWLRTVTRHNWRHP